MPGSSWSESTDQVTHTLTKLSQLAGQRFPTSEDATAAVLETITDVLGMRTSWVSEVDHAACELDIVAAHNDPGGCSVEAGGSAPLPSTFCSMVVTAEAPRPVIIQDVRNNPDFASSVAAQAFPNIGSYIGVPIMLSDGSVHGTLCASDPEPRQISNDQAQVLSVFSRLLATQIERDREFAARGETEQRFNAFMDHSPVIAYMKDADGRYVYANKTMGEAFNLDPSWLYGKTDFDWLDASLAEKTRLNDLEVLRTGRTHQFPEQTLDADGQPRHWYSMKFPVRDATGRTFLAGVSTDITKQRIQEIRSAMLAAIVHDTQDAIYARTLDGTVRTWNPAAEQLYGYSAQEMIGSSLEILVPEGMPNDVPEITRRVMEGERVTQHETRRRTRDGRVLDVQLTISLIRDPDGKVIGTSTIARDVTEHKRLIAERDRLYAELREDVARAAEIQTHLLPRAVPVLRGFEFAAACRPAREVGGDFFDWSQDDDAVRITLGDVTGKGMPAALLMATTRAALRGAAAQTVEKAITAVNRALMADLSYSSAFVTMFHAELKPDGQLTYTDAGHGMALVLRRDGSADPLTQRQVPVGVLEETRYTCKTTHLEEGDTLIVYSDGLPDSRPDLCLEQHANVAALCFPGMDVDQMLHRLEHLTEGHGPRPDDLTLIAVRRQEETL